MLKKSLIAIAVLAIAMPALAGQIKIHDPWPTTLVPQSICTIDVTLDVGYFIHIKDQDPIKVNQDGSDGDPYHDYTGCKTTDVTTNFAANLTISVGSTSAGGGSWSGSITPSAVPIGTTNVQICVSGKDVAIEKLYGGTKNVKVAEATINVVPAS
jgi:hypothetical protein